MPMFVSGDPDHLEVHSEEYEEYLRDMEQWRIDCAIDLLKEAGILV